MDTTELRDAVADLAARAEGWLMREFGSAEAFVHGFGYHNRTHGDDVSSAAERIASGLCEAGRVTRETVLLAPYAGWGHDAFQGPGHERRSAVLAAEWMRGRGVPDRHVATVMKMIEATKVVRIEGGRIVQAADPDDAEQALLADADLASLGRRSGLYRALLLHVEQQHLKGLVAASSPSAGIAPEPDREATIAFLEFQTRLLASHRYLLPVSRKLFPHQSEHRDEAGMLCELYAADRITWPQMLRYARRLAYGEPRGRTFEAGVATRSPASGRELRAETATIAVVGVVNSVAATASMSAAEQYEYAATLLGLFQSAGESTRGTLVRDGGDSVTCAFENPERALDFAAACQFAVRSHNRDAKTDTAIRVGVSHGEVVTGTGGMHGQPLQLAARLCAAAEPAEILVTAGLRQEMSDDPSVVFGDAREIAAKGVGRPIVYPLIWTTSEL